MKKIQKMIAIFIAMSLILSIGSSAFASGTTKKGNLTQAFLDASDNTIVCYMDGYAIRKNQVDENGVIKQEAIQNIEQSKFARSDTPTPVYDILTDGYTNAIVRNVLVAPRYSQTNTIYYFTEENAEEFASSIQYSTLANFFIWVTGFIPKVGTFVALTMGVNRLYKSCVATQITDLTNNHHNVKISEASSSFGVFYGVFEWSGRAFATHNIYDSVSIYETVENVQISK